MQELFWFLFRFSVFSFSGRSPRRQTSKMTVWEISFNPREFLSILFAFVFPFCPFFSLLGIFQCFFFSCIYFVAFFFGVITKKNFYWRSSHHHYNGPSNAFFSLSRSGHCRCTGIKENTQKRNKIHSLIFSMFCCFFLRPSHSDSWEEKNLVSENIRRRWIIHRNCIFFFFLLRMHQNSIEISEKKGEIAAIITWKCIGLVETCESQVVFFLPSCWVHKVPRGENACRR